MKVPDTLTSALFDSLLQEPPWLSFLSELEQYLDGQHATMVLRRPRPGDPGVLISTQSNTAALVLLQNSIFRESPFLDLPLDDIAILSEMLSRQELTQRHTNFFTYLQDYGATDDLIGINLEDPETGMVFRLRCARARGQAHFSAGDRAKLAALIPWLRTAIALYARLAKRDYQLSISDATVDQLAIGSLVLGDGGEVLIANPVADRVLQHADGLLIDAGCLRCSSSESTVMLRAALNRLTRDASAQRTESLQILRPAGQHWSVLMQRIAPQPGIEESASMTTLLLFRDAAGTQIITEELLMELFALTRAEAILTKRLVEGESLAEISDSLGRSRHTTRAQLAAIFSKTGTNRQPQLVSHVLRAAQQMWGE